jgi:hypothetical protein
MSGHKKKKAQLNALSKPSTLPEREALASSEPTYTQTQLIRFLQDVRIMSELDFIQGLSAQEPTKITEAVQSLKSTIQTKFRNLLQLKTGNVTDTPLKSTHAIPAGQRHAYDISGESPSGDRTDARYTVFSQGFKAGEIIIEPARVSRVRPEDADAS